MTTQAVNKSAGHHVVHIYKMDRNVDLQFPLLGIVPAQIDAIVKGCLARQRVVVACSSNQKHTTCSTVQVNTSR